MHTCICRHRCGHVSCSHEPFVFDLSLPMPRLSHAMTDKGSGEGEGEGGGGCEGSDEGMEREVLAELPSELTAPHDELSLAACLQAFCAPERLRGENAYECEACSGKCAADSHATVGGDVVVEPPPSPPSLKQNQPALRWTQVSQLPRTLMLCVNCSLSEPAAPLRGVGLWDRSFGIGSRPLGLQTAQASLLVGLSLLQAPQALQFEGADRRQARRACALPTGPRLFAVCMQG